MLIKQRIYLSINTPFLSPFQSQTHHLLYIFCNNTCLGQMLSCLFQSELQRWNNSFKKASLGGTTVERVDRPLGSFSSRRRMRPSVRNLFEKVIHQKTKAEYNLFTFKQSLSLHPKENNNKKSSQSHAKHQPQNTSTKEFKLYIVDFNSSSLRVLMSNRSQL